MERLRHNKLIWGSNGELQLESNNIFPVIADQNRCNQVIQQLKGLQALTESKTHYTLDRVKVLDILESTKNKDYWKYQALMAVVHAFPEHRQLEPAL